MSIRMMKMQNHYCGAKKVHMASSITSVSGLDKAHSIETNTKGR
jgi:hypothetical protein